MGACANKAVAIRYCDSGNIVSEVEEAISTGAGTRAGADASAAGAGASARAASHVEREEDWEWEDGSGAGWDSASGGAAEEDRLMREPLCPDSSLQDAMGKLQCGSGREMTPGSALSRAQSCTCKLVCHSSRTCATGVLVDGRELGLPHFCILTCAVSAHQSPTPPSSLSTDCFVVIKHVVTLSDDKWVAHFGDGEPIALEMPSPLEYFATPCGK